MKDISAKYAEITERAGFDLPSLCKILNNLILQLNFNKSKDLNSLVDLLFLHDLYYLVMYFEGDLRATIRAFLR